MILRRTTISKCFAVGLVFLAVSPFTAPFATCDFGDSTRPEGSDLGISVHDETLLKKVASESHLVGVPTRSILPPFLSGSEAPSLNPASHSNRRRALHSILRL